MIKTRMQLGKILKIEIFTIIQIKSSNKSLKHEFKIKK